MIPSANDFEQSTSPKLRADLRIGQASESASAFFVLEDSLAGKCYELGAREAHCLMSCDGRRSVGEILASQPNVANLPRLTADNFRQLVSWALAKQLLVDHSDQAIGRQQTMYQAAARANWVKWTNPISISISLGSPAPLLRYLTPKLCWIFDHRWLPLAACTVAYALYCLYIHAEKFSNQAIAIWADQQWLTLVIVWLLIKVIHELAHGIVAQRYGTQVRDAGLFLVLFLPLAYVDVSNSARLPNRWKRIHIAAAGMYVELVLAAVATIVWAWTTNVTLASWMHAVVVSAGVSTLIFNANPLMRFDGYYILADLIGIPNLASRGKQWFWGTIKRWCLGIPSTPIMLPTSKRLMIAIYGIAALAWRMILQITLVIAAAALFYGLGVLVAILAILHYAMEPLIQLSRFARNEQPWRKWRVANVTGSLVAAAAMLWMLTSALTGPVYLNAPAVVRFPAEQLVRAASDGFVSSIRVRHGEEVVAGQTLAVLSNPALCQQVEALQFQLAQAEQKARMAREKAEWSEYDNQQRFAAGLRAQLSERRIEIAHLELRAPCNGRVWNPEVEQLAGQYVRSGTAIMTIDDGRKELAVSISQDDLAAVSEWKDARVQIVFPNLPITPGQLRQIQPNASETVPAAALARPFGGPLLVQPASSTETKKPRFVRSQSANEESIADLKLIVPRVTGIVELPDHLQETLPVGHTGAVFLPARRQSLASYIVTETRRWLSGHLQSMRHAIRANQ
ncbi:MAG: efflux RND transporter periplasmic adaptor subunit [Planctomycetaceae bacterium]|nr:efflux RND transporter periplasmic adaptor subunit [Planctomycetaceae bacterium]